MGRQHYCGVFEFNPYEDNEDNLKTIVSPVTYCTGKDNPGFAPYTEIGKYKGYAEITGHFNDDYGSYFHEGTDFTGNNALTPIQSFINGKVVVLGDQDNLSYGKFMIIGTRQFHRPLKAR